MCLHCKLVIAASDGAKRVAEELHNELLRCRMECRMQVLEGVEKEGDEATRNKSDGELLKYMAQNRCLLEALRSGIGP